MRSLLFLGLLCLVTVLIPAACVDSFDQTLPGTNDILVVDGTITNLAEPQLIRINRSTADRLTGRFGSTPVTKATVEVVVDYVVRIACHETLDGTYQLPADFKAEIGHTYQLRFTLANGVSYQSSLERLLPVAPIILVRAEFNANSLSSTQRLLGSYPAAHDFYVDFSDPADESNYYRWQWIDWERQEWCRSCSGGRYQMVGPEGKLIEDCVNETFTFPRYDYNCRNKCWEILYGNELVLFGDEFSNGRPITSLRIAQVPLYSKEHCLVEIRQESLTRNAYTYYKQLDDQTRNSGGVASAQPAILVGNIVNLTDNRDSVIGYFTVSGVSSVRYWLTRSDATGFAPGLFQALSGGLNPANEPSIERNRPPLAVCVSSNSRTPFKPEGWRD
ncbi:hypothetical protein GCM10027341_46970 [Spirosoma knui]